MIADGQKAGACGKKKRRMPIRTEFIRLDAALKLSGAAPSGGRAKFVIQNGQVLLNGEVCLQRGKKLRPGDILEFENVQYEAVKE